MAVGVAFAFALPFAAFAALAAAFLSSAFLPGGISATTIETSGR